MRAEADPTRHKTPAPQAKAPAPSSGVPQPAPRIRTEQYTEVYMPSNTTPQLPSVIHARYLRGGRWVPVRVGALSLKGAVLLAGALPRSEDHADIAFAFGSNRATVRGVVGKVSTNREATQTGAATFAVSFDLDDATKRQLTQLLMAARDAKITISHRRRARRAGSRSSPAPARPAAAAAAPSTATDTATTGAAAGAATATATRRRRLVAVTACPTGIAHTYMAAEALEAAAERAGVDIAVETQGSAGSSPLHHQTIADADAAIFAVDVGVRDRHRFAGKPLVSSGVKRPMDDADAMIAEALRYADDPRAPRVEGTEAGADTASGAGSESWGTHVRRVLMTGVPT